jgi:mono/diheme cytochrome c family protein
MFKRLFFTALAAAFVVSMGYAQQSTTKVNIPVNKTPAYSGKQMYTSYCAPCHGVDGRGNGPVAAALKVAPSDLTLLSKDHNGKFPSTHVMAVLQFGAETPAHGTAQMPIWGPIFGQMDHPAMNQDVQTLRISNLTRYVETLQAK